MAFSSYSFIIACNLSTVFGTGYTFGIATDVVTPPAAQASGRGVDVLFVRVARFTMVAVRIDKAGDDGFAANVHHFLGGRLHADFVQANDAAVFDADRCSATPLVVDYKSVGQQHIQLLCQFAQPPFRLESTYHSVKWFV